jgi:lipopolysaccharide/colanic/teichoic acid biosynthesis glycosyltransferase
MKRVIDLVASILLVASLCLPLLLLCLLQLALIGRPIFFRQQRAGRKGQTLSILKFRSMRIGTGSDAERLTGWGTLLRSTSLDELPELWNVLRGEMSLVGPRPLPIRYLQRYSAEQARRHDVRPGITGWAQINGRNHLSWKQQFELDLWYIDHQGCWLDLKILTLTIFTVLRRERISEQRHATRSEFMGNDQ